MSKNRYLNSQEGRTRAEALSTCESSPRSPPCSLPTGSTTETLPHSAEAHIITNISNKADVSEVENESPCHPPPGSSALWRRVEHSHLWLFLQM